MEGITSGIKVVLTDIEGTTTSLSFVKDVLFPYAGEKMAAFVTANAEDEAVAKLLNDVRAVAGDESLSVEQIITTLQQWIDEDQKITPLKALQGLIWDAGYKNGDFTGHVYEDAYKNLLNWHEQGIKLYVFSSGSVKAQKLIYGYSDFGDMTPLFSGYFDTNIGNKRESQAYEKIANEIGLPAASILFLSDVVEELDAAAAVGMKTLQLIREAQPAAPNHASVANFDEIRFG